MYHLQSIFPFCSLVFRKNYRQGMFTMSFNFYILLEDDEESSFQILKSLNANVKTKYPEKNPEVSLSKDDHNFKGIDQILNSHHSE